MHAENSELKFANCNFKRNVSPIDGGAVSIGVDTTCAFDACTFDENVATDNGGAVSSIATANFDGCHMISNLAKKNGGVAFGTGFVFNNCSVSLNRAWDKGGVLHGAADFIACDFSSNTASNGGVAYATVSTSMVDSTITNGCAETEGAAIYSTSSVTIRRVTIQEVGTDCTADRRRRTTLTDGSQHVIFHDAADLSLVLDTVTFVDNAMLAIGSSDSSNVLLRNCEGLTAEDVVDASLATCDTVGTECPSEYCKEVLTGIEVSSM